MFSFHFTHIYLNSMPQLSDNTPCITGTQNKEKQKPRGLAYSQKHVNLKASIFMYIHTFIQYSKIQLRQIKELNV